jgi:hypothetical protein
VEKRSFPIWMGNTGVMLPCTMACTAIGMKGVVVAASVAVLAGEGVITKYVGVGATGAAVFEAGGVEEAADVAVTVVPLA